MSNLGLTGYGPRNRLIFDGDESKYELWEVKFLGYLRTQKLHDVLAADTPDAEKNAQVFAELVQFLDDRSLSLIIRDAKDNGKQAIKILREHYLGTSKPRIIALYTELTSLKMGDDERCTDYVIRAETAATSLKTAGETVSDSLLEAMVLKGLPPDYKTFCTVVTQRQTAMTFQEFKVALRSFEESEKCQNPHRPKSSEDNVMNVNSNPGGKNIIKCFKCGKQGHKAYECRNRWCEICKNRTHDTNYCRSKKKNTVKTVSDRPRDDYENVGQNKDNDTFAFKVSTHPAHPFKKDTLLVDSGATTHIVTDRSKFIEFDGNFKPVDHVIELADGTRTKCVAQGRGDASVKLHDVNGNFHDVLMKNVLYVPSYNSDIFSVQAATEKGATVVFAPNYAELIAGNGKAKFNIEKRDKLYFLNNVCTLKCNSHTVEEWHRILGHCNVKDVIKLENVVKGMHISNISSGKKDFECETCIMGKMSQYRNRAPDKRATRNLELVHCDLAGPIDPIARDNFKYAISFVDDYSGIIMVYFLKNKSDTVAATERFLADSSPYGNVKRMRTDGGTEFTSGDFRSLLVKNRIKQEFSAPYSPHQNGTVERSWRTLFEMARCLLLEAKLPKKLWTYAVKTSAYIRNRCYNSRTGITPFEALTGEKPNLDNMHIFGTVCYAYLQNKKKLDARSEQGIFLGYDTQSPAYQVYFPDRDDVRKVRCVKFNEKFLEKVEVPDVIDEYPRPKTLTPEPEENLQPEMKDTEESEDKEDGRGYPRRERSKPKHLEDYVSDFEDDEVTNVAKCSVYYCYRMSDIPNTYEEAIKSPESHQWQKAMEEEVKALGENDTYELTSLPDGRSVIGGKWVYTKKLGPENNEKFKARYVAKGYSQVESVDYHETFSPTAKLTSVRMLMQLAVQDGMLVHQMDVKTAYLNADIDTEIYIEQPKGFIKTDKGQKLVCKLKKSLYGLKQSGRNWNNLLNRCLVEMNFVQSLADPCVYTKFEGNTVIIIIFWVDDIIIAASDNYALTMVKKCLNDRFKMKDMGKISWFLGIEFTFGDGYIMMNQTEYCKKILDRFNMKDCKPKAIPCDPSVNKITIDDSTELADPKLYREIVGSLIYVMTGTRPDICYAVTKLAQHMSEPTKAHLGLAKHVLKYIKGTINYGLKFSKSSNPLRIIGFCDSDWGASEDRRSITGYTFQLNSKGPLISWKSRKQRVVALSTCEAEYMSITFAMQEANFLRQLYTDMKGYDKGVVSLYVDNQGAIALAKNPVHHQRSKHIDIRYHFIRSEVESGIVDLIYVPSEDNISDVFTKPVSKNKLKKFSVIRGET